MNRVSVATHFVRWLEYEYHVLLEDVKAATSDPERMRAIAKIIKRESPLLDQQIMLLPLSTRFKKALLRAGGREDPTNETVTTLRGVLPHITLDSLRKARYCGAQTIVEILVFLREQRIELPHDPYKELCTLMKQSNPSPAEMTLFLQKNI